MKNVNKEQLNELKQSDKLIIVDFYADWCGPCKMLTPVMEKISESNQSIEVVKVNVDEEFELASDYQVISIPKVVFIKNNNIVHEFTGAKPQPVIQGLIDQHQ